MSSSSLSSLSSLSINPNESLLSQLNDVYASVDAKLNINDCPELVKNCRAIHEKAKHVISYAKDYDYNDIEANGYWTYSKLVVKYGKVILSTYKRGKSHETLLPVSQVLIAGLDLCEEFHRDTIDNKQYTGSNEYLQLFTSSPDEFIHLLSIFKSLAPQLDTVYGSYCAYWLCPSMRRSMQGFTTIMAVYACSLGKSLPDRLWACKNLWDRKYRSHMIAHIAQNATVEFVKSFWGLAELSIVKHALPSLMLRSQPKVIKNVYVPRQNEWIISDVRAEVIRRNTCQANGETSPKVLDSKVKCKLIQHCPESRPTDSLVLHLHGGGFVSQSPESHEVYLREWAVNLSGIPILSVDYSLSPESKYPIALQEVLDVYLWVISKDVSVEESLGFQPSKVVVCGDSAGGNLSAALCLVLNDIRKQIDKDADEKYSNFRVPMGVLCFYTPFNLRTIPSPSRLLTAVDTLLPLGVLLSCLEAYAGTSDKSPLMDKILNKSPESKHETLVMPSQLKLSPVSPSSGVSEGESEHDSNLLFDYASLHFTKPSDSDCEKLSSDDEYDKTTDDADYEFNDFVHITYDDVPPDEDLLFEIPNDLSFKFQRQCCNTIRKIRQSIMGSSDTFTEPHPWYRSNDVILKNKLDNLNDATMNPFVSPYLATEFDFDDIPLYLVALHYDACLDDSISMAKKWKGSVSLDVLDELPHGFLNFVLLSDEGKRGSELCLSRIRKALELE